MASATDQIEIVVRALRRGSNRFGFDQEIHSSQRGDLISILEILEQDQETAAVGAGTGYRQQSATDVSSARYELRTGAKTLGVVAQNLDQHFSPNPVGFAHVADQDEVSRIG